MQKETLGAKGGPAMALSSNAPARAPISIWWFAAGYFLVYVPYSALVKSMSRPGMLPGMDGLGFDGFAMLPTTALASLVGMFIFLTVMGWWKHAGHKTIFGKSLPCPNRYTFLSGLCIAVIIPTTTMAYTFDGLSIVFMMLLMRGGVLVLAPIVDLISKRRVRWFSWTALLLSLGALLISLRDVHSYKMTLVAALDVVAYLGAYFFRLRYMSRLAKSNDENVRARYFVEEQMTATPMLVIGLILLAIVGAFAGDVEGARTGLTNLPVTFGLLPIARTVYYGFTGFLTEGYLHYAIIIGLFSQGTGIFGGLVLLDRRENTYCVPVNRSSSILAGILASYALVIFLDARPPALSQLIGTAMIFVAIMVLSIPPMVEKHRAKGRNATQQPETAANATPQTPSAVAGSAGEQE